jgi:hypothetical protein
MTKKKNRKQRTQYIYGTTKGVIDQLEYTIDQSTGEINFGPNVGNIYSETTYERAKGPKVLWRVPQSGEMYTFNTDTALKKNYDFLCAVDTNNREIQGRLVSVTGVLVITPILEGNGTFWKFDVPFCIEFVGLKEPRENFGWVCACEQLWIAGKLTHQMRVGMIVDSDLGKINDFNQRKIPLFGSFRLPNGLQLLYASADSGMDNVVNKSLATADSLARQVLDAVESGRVPFNDVKVASPYYEGYRLVEPRNIKRTN